MTDTKANEIIVLPSSVVLDDVTHSKNGDAVIIIGIISTEELINGLTRYSKYKVSFEIRYDNYHLKLISGKGEKIE